MKRSRSRQVVHWGRRALLLEWYGYVSIFRFVFRRPRVPAGATGFSYHRPVMPVLIVLIVVSAVELVVVDLVVQRWPAVRVPLLVLGVWGLVWMLGLLFGFLTRPHAVGPAGLRVRAGAEVDIPLAWDDVETLGRHQRIARTRQPRVTTGEDGGSALHLPMQQETCIDVRLRRPVPVRVPNGPETVTTIHLYADSPQEFIDEVRRHRVDVLAPSTR